METEEPPGAQVSGWLQAAHQHVLTYLQEGGGGGAPELGDDVIRCIQTFCPRLPLSYSFTTVSQLLTLQKSPCVSVLGWDTERFQQWGHQGLQRAKASQPPAVLTRARLLLVGYLSERPKREGPVHDGNLYARDSSGCVPCEMTELDLNLLGSLVLFPCWSYIPTQHGGGYVEVLSPPISVVTPVLGPAVREEAPAEALNPNKASQLLCDRSHPPGFRVTVIGQLTSVTSLINIRNKHFFFFFLQDTTKSVPVIVKISHKLCWFHSLRMGDTYEVTSLSVSSLRGCAHQIFAVTSSSCLLPRPALSPPSSSSFTTEDSKELTAPPGGGAEERFNLQDNVNVKQVKVSKTLTYEGVVTRVRDADAGLYELDGAVVLCTAYTQLQNGGRGLREGARVEVCDAHLQQSPSRLFPTIVLSACLRSRVRVSEFSRLSAPCPLYSGFGNLHLHLLFHYRLRLPEYLWVCDIMRKLQEKFQPPLVRQRCLTRPSASSSQSATEKLLHSSLSSMAQGRSERNLYEEMVAKPHDCPLQEYSPLPPPWCLPPLADFLPLGCKSEYLRRTESKSNIEWCHYCLLSEDLSPPQVLLGVLHASSRGFLQLKDQSASLTCLILPTPPIAWIGCVLEVRRYQLVVETLQCKDRGAEQQNRTYVVFLAADVTVLHSPRSCPSCSDLGPAGASSNKMRRVDPSWARRPLLIESMEGLLTKPGHREGLQFQAKASWRDEQGSAPGGQEPSNKVLLLFSSSSVRWFPFLHPNRQYQIIGSKETEVGVSDWCVDGLRCVKVPSDWSMEDVEVGVGVEAVMCVWGDDLFLCPQSCDGDAGSFSIEEALSSSGGCLVSVSGVVSSRSLCDLQNTDGLKHRARPPDNFLPPGVTVKVTLTHPVSQSMVSVYLDLTLAPYPLGLLLGATVLMQGLEKKVSRSGRAYLRSVATTYISILTPPTEIRDSPPAPPLVPLRYLSGLPRPQRAVCSVTFVLSVALSWHCSACSSTFTQGSCEHSPFCTSQSGVFRAKACVKAEDGSGEVQLYLQDDAVCLLLAAPSRLWEVLQRQVLARGKVTVQNRGRTEHPSAVHSDDPLIDHVTFLMSRPVVCRPLVVTFRQTGEGGAPAAAQLARFTRGDRDYVTRIPSPPTLTCLQLQEVEPRVLCHMIRERQAPAS